MKKSTVVSLLIFGILLAAYFATRESKIKVGVKTLDLPKFDTKQVDAIRISQKNIINLARDGENWQVFQGESKDNPAKYLANSNDVKNLLQAASQIQSNDLVTERSDKHEQYKIDDKNATIVEISQGPLLKWSIMIGDASGNGRYIRLKNANEVFSAKAPYYQILKNDLIDWREKKILPLKKDAVKSVELFINEMTQISALYKNDEKIWSMPEFLKNAPKNIDAKKIQNFVDNIINMSAKEFIDNAEQQATIKAIIANTNIKLKLKDGAKEYILRFGNDKKSNKYYASMDEKDEAYEITEASFKNATITLDSLKDLHVIKIDPNKAEKITLNLDNQTIKLHNKDNKWSIIEPKKLPAGFEYDPQTVDRFILSLNNLQAEKSLAKAADKKPKLSGIKSIIVEDKNAKKHVLDFYMLNKTESWTQSLIDSANYSINNNQLASFDKGLEFFRKDKGFEGLPPELQKQIQEAAKKAMQNKKS